MVISPVAPADREALIQLAVDTELFTDEEARALLGGVLRRYAREGSGLVSRAIMSGVTNHRLGERRLDNSARVGPWILLSTQGWDELAVVDLRAEDRVERIPMPASIVQIVASSSRTAAAVLTRAGLMLWKRPAA